MTKRKVEYWVIPPKQDAEFVAIMEEVLETSPFKVRNYLAAVAANTLAVETCGHWAL